MSIVRPAVTMTVLSTLVFGFGYPLAMTGAAQALFPHQAAGSLIERESRVVGSELIGQSFSDPRYVQGRPSAADYNAASSTGSNYGPTSTTLVNAIRERSAAVVAEDGAVPPADRVTASGSGLDPHLSPASALMQAGRIATARGVPEAAVRDLIAGEVTPRPLGFLGEETVNVLATNLALDDAFPAATAPAAAVTTPAGG